MVILGVMNFERAARDTESDDEAELHSRHQLCYLLNLLFVSTKHLINIIFTEYDFIIEMS